MNSSPQGVKPVAGVVAARLRTYWRLEAMNVVVLPASVLLMVISAGGSASWQLALAFLANMVLLVIGACYWRIVLCRIEGDGAPAKNWIPRIARAEPIAAILTAATVLATVSDSIAPAGGWTPERYAVAAMCTLAVLEYVNYYHFQLQYFDHWPDFAALVRRKTLRRSHMSLEIAEWRRSRA